MKKLLIFDTETTGLPREYLDFRSHRAKYYWKNARMTELAWCLVDEQAAILSEGSYAKADGDDWILARKEFSESWGIDHVLGEFLDACTLADALVGHNVGGFDVNVVGYELKCAKMDHSRLVAKPWICTMQNSIDFCAIPRWDDDYKYPSLMELHQVCFGGRGFEDAHSAFADMVATKNCYFELIRQGVEMYQCVPEPDEAFKKPKPKPPKQLPEGVPEYSLEGISWVCQNSKAKKRLQGVVENLSKYGLGIQDLSYDARISFAANCIKKGFDFMPRTHFAHDGVHVGQKISNYSSSDLIGIWRSWGGFRDGDGWDQRLDEYEKYMQGSMCKYFEKIEANVKKRRAEVRRVLKGRKKAWEKYKGDFD